MTDKPAFPAALPPLPTLATIFDQLTERFGFSARASQITLAERVRDTMATKGSVCCIEAPTGTGKTLGYLAGALDAQAHSGNPVPIVVATATVGLQEQILRYDIPRLAAVGAINPRKVAVAKGRGRYFCPRTTALLEDKKMQDSQLDLLDADKPVAEAGVPIALDMLKAWKEGRWDGDKDSWPGTIPKCWESSCGANSDTCVNRACEYFDKCPYMASRHKLGLAEVIVANHDIVLSDLAQRAEEQSNTVLPPREYVLIFDEAHNLPDKAVHTRQARVCLTENKWLRELAPYGEMVFHLPQMVKALHRQTDFTEEVFSVDATLLAGGLERLAQQLERELTFNVSGNSSWGRKPPEETLLEEVITLTGWAIKLVSAFKAAAKAYAEYAEEAVGKDKSHAVHLLAKTYKYQREAEELYNGLSLFCSRDPLVRWATRTREGDLLLTTQPMEGREVLEQLLWKTQFPVALVSATLQIAGSFERFRDKSGLPATAFTQALAPVFDYSRGFLHEPHMNTDPGHPGYEAELHGKLNLLLEHSKALGILILFTSRETMRRVIKDLNPDYQDEILVQDNRPIPELVAEHKARIDRGDRSILIGLDSMSEGLDLPGVYCGHVVITRLPFAVPSDPVEEARQEYLGHKWFKQAYLADMITMLIQSTGRLIRRETDHGVISILDRRLWRKQYGALAKAAMPNFAKLQSLLNYDQIMKERGFDKTYGAGSKPKASEPPQLTQVIGGAHHKPKTDPATTAIAPATVRLASVPVRPDPMESVLRHLHSPLVASPARYCTVDNLIAVLADCRPPAKGPFAEGEPDYLNAEESPLPCLPAGTTAYVYAERNMPSAVLLGLVLRNTPWDRKAPLWRQVLSLRADLHQFADVLRSHLKEIDDPRCALLPLETCVHQLEQSLGWLGLPSWDEVCQVVDRLESEAVVALGEPHELPSQALMLDMVDVAQALVREHSQPRAVA